MKRAIKLAAVAISAAFVAMMPCVFAIHMNAWCMVLVLISTAFALLWVAMLACVVVEINDFRKHWRQI